MRAELVLFGKRINMARQQRRRALVVCMYAGFAALMGVLWPTTHLRHTGAYVLYAVIAVCWLFLGGITPRGLVKPFNGKAPRMQTQISPLSGLRLEVYPPVLPGDEAEFQNDEREVHQRDRAHYLAYQAVGVAVAMLLSMALFRSLFPAWFGWMGVNPDELYFGILLALAVMMMTLPQAVLLWTEPDMEEES
ncbi:MAG: hypothetical protein P4L03_09840 [Terracidiphilus sp.]|nr:hypothetical protein [Terracidiphilus sp.]